MDELINCQDCESSSSSGAEKGEVPDEMTAVIVRSASGRATMQQMTAVPMCWRQKARSCSWFGREISVESWLIGSPCQVVETPVFEWSWRMLAVLAYERTWHAILMNAVDCFLLYRVPAEFESIFSDQMVPG